MRSKALLILVIVLLTSISSCKKDKADDPPNNSNPNYENGSGTIGQNGGTVSMIDEGSPINGSYVEIPQNAISGDKTISITQIHKGVSFTGDERVIIVGFEPHGLQFNQEVEIGVPIPAEYEFKMVHAYYLNTSNEQVNQINIERIDENKRLAIIKTDHFSGYFAGYDGQPCPGVTSVLIEGTEYPTVVVDDKCWLAKNLNVGTMISSPTFQSDNGTVEKYCYDNNEANCNEYGGLYHWDEMMQYANEAGSQGICPDGWHIPTYEEYDQFFNYARYVAYLNSSPHDYTPIFPGGSLNFNAVLSGAAYPDGEFDMLGEYGLLWTSDELNDVRATYRAYQIDFVWNVSEEKTYSMAARCIKDDFSLPPPPEENYPPTEPTNLAPEDESTNISIDTELSWYCSDPDGDPLTYSVYFGISQAPPLVAESYNAQTYDPGNLEENTTYYWQIVAFDDHDNSNTGPLWSFTTDNGGTNTPPTAIFTVSPYSGSTSTTFEFDASDSYDNEDPTSDLQVRWDFDGDGTWDTPCSIDKTASHQYSLAGEYTILMEVQDTEGLTDQSEQSITITGGSNTPPAAEFTVTPSSGSTSTTFEFDGSDSYDNEDPTSDLQVRWDLDGNGSWDTGWDYDKTENHQYSSEGTYTAKMEVKDTEGLTDYTTQTVTVDNGGGGNGCDGQATLTYGGQTYDLVEIGDQCWMAENLNIGTRIDGSEEMEDNGTIEKYCYDDDENNCDEYGGLYQWNEMMQYTTQQGTQGICPDGWHLPSDDEWCTLTTYIDPTVDCDEVGWSGTDAGYKMKSTSGWYSNGNGSDAYGFAALPGGHRNHYGSFNDIEKCAYFWSSTEHGSNAWYRYLYYGSDAVYRINSNQDYGFSVRCLKD